MAIGGNPQAGQPRVPDDRDDWWKRLSDGPFSAASRSSSSSWRWGCSSFTSTPAPRGATIRGSGPSSTRGLITLLFSVGKMVIAVVLILTAVFHDEDEDKAKARFDRAKEVLTLLIGVFGTIVGFYFGSVGREQGGGVPDQTRGHPGRGRHPAGRRGDAGRSQHQGFRPRRPDQQGRPIRWAWSSIAPRSPMPPSRACTG